MRARRRTARAWLLASCTWLVFGSLVAAPGVAAPIAASSAVDAVDAADAVVPVRGPGTVGPGELITLQVGPFPQDQGAADVIVTGSYGTWVRSATVVDGMTDVPVPTEATFRSGLLTIAVIGAGGTARTTVEVTPGPVVEPVTPLVGARAIQADGEHWAMVVTIPEDAFGNPAAEGTSVALRALHPDGIEDRFELAVEGAITWTRVFSRTLAGRTRVAAAVGDVRGPEADLLEVPGPPADVPLERDDQPLVADGRSLVAVRTARLTDAFGNVVADGTDVRFAVRSPDGVRALTAPTVNGVAEVVLEAPTLPGEVTVVATAAGTSGSPLVLPYGSPAPGEFDVVATRTDDLVRVEVGPVLGDLGQYLPDGTEVEVTVRTDRRTLTATTALDGGSAVVEVWVDTDRVRDVTVAIAGALRTVAVTT